MEPGDVIDDTYEVDRVIGRGGMGFVVLARHVQLGQKVAIKCLQADGLDDPLAAKRFLREARASVSLKSEHVAHVFGLGTHQGVPYMVMEYLDGRDLDRVIEDGALSVSDAVDFMLQACEAIAEAHAGGLVHRDLKPANLFLTERPDGAPMVKVLDFGIAKVVQQAKSPKGATGLTATGTTLGTPMYMSPEQVRDSTDVDVRTDIWSLGTVLYQLLTGMPPFDGDTVPSLCAKIVADPPPPLEAHRPDVPIGLGRLVARCLEKDRTARFQTVAELALALAPFASEHGKPYVDRIVGITTRAAPRSSPQATPRDATTAATEAATPFPKPSDDDAVEAETRVQTQSSAVVSNAPPSAKPAPHGNTGWIVAALALAVLGVTLLWTEPWASPGVRPAGQQDTASPSETAAPTVVATPSAVVATPSATVVTTTSAAPSARAVASSEVPSASASARGRTPAPRPHRKAQDQPPPSPAPPPPSPQPRGSDIDPLADPW